MRKFERIDENVFLRDIPTGNYSDIVLPKRSTKNSAGYDFYSIISFTLNPGERKIIPTGVRVIMNNDEYLALFIRSSLGFKYNIRMCNQVGIIDADYYGNSDNGGHIFVCLENEGDMVLEIKKGDIVLLIDLSNKLYSNHGKRRDFVFVDEELLPIDEKEKRNVIEDTYNAITEMWGLNDPIKNIPKTFII